MENFDRYSKLTPVIADVWEEAKTQYFMTHKVTVDEFYHFMSLFRQSLNEWALQQPTKLFDDDETVRRIVLTNIYRRYECTNTTMTEEDFLESQIANNAEQPVVEMVRAIHQQYPDIRAQVAEHKFVNQFL